jgi:hypothetical protein
VAARQDSRSNNTIIVQLVRVPDIIRTGYRYQVRYPYERGLPYLSVIQMSFFFLLLQLFLFEKTFLFSLFIIIMLFIPRILSSYYIFISTNEDIEIR